MLDNSITVRIVLGEPTEGVAVSVTDTDAGRTLREYNHGSGVFTTLTTGHQTNSNKDRTKSDRYVVRLGQRKPSEVLPGTELELFAQLTFGVPQSTQFSLDDAKGMIQGLVLFLLQCTGSTSPTITTVTNAFFDPGNPADVLLGRLLNNET